MSSNSTEQWGPTADMISVAALALSVIYAEGSYDAWDIALAGVVVALCWRRLVQTGNDSERPQRIVARVGLALAIQVFIEALVEATIFLIQQLHLPLPPLSIHIPEDAQPWLLALITSEILGVVTVMLLYLLISKNDKTDVFERTNIRMQKLFRRRS
jgi:hypothetical protein